MDSCLQDDAAIGDSLHEGIDDDSDDSDYTQTAEEMYEEGVMSDDDYEEQDADELREEIREEHGTINSPTRSCCIACKHCKASCLSDLSSGTTARHAASAIQVRSTDDLTNSDISNIMPCMLL